MTYHIAICNDDSRDAGYVSELLHQWAQLRGCAETEERFHSAEGFMSRPESTWKCRWCTLCPACSPMLDTTR